MMDKITAEAWTIWLELAPWLLLGAAVAGVMHVLLPASFLRRQFAGRGGVWKAAALGVPLPLCSCGVIPVGLSLRQHGASRGATVAFLVSTPQTGIDSLLVSANMLGLAFAFFKVGSALVLGVIAGLLADWWTPPTATEASSSARSSGSSENGHGEDACASHGGGGRLRAALDHAAMLIESIWPWLLFGVAASAVIAHFSPQLQLQRAAAYGGLPAMFAALAIGAPLYVCATASVPIAAALVAAGLPAGAALVFLIAGPATNLSTMGAVYRALGGRTLIAYLGTICVGSIACGLTFDGLLSATPSTAVAAMHEHGQHAFGPAATICGAILAALIAWFAWRALQARFALRRRGHVVMLPVVTRPDGE